MDMIAIDLRKAELIVSSFSKAASGHWIMNGKHWRFTASSTNSVIGTTVLEALDQSAKSIVVYDPKVNPSSSLLTLVGVRTYSAYMSGVREVEIEREDGVIRLIPTTNGGNRSGFTQLAGETELIVAGSPEQIGAAVNRALDAATA
jgi:hypothetical protein